MDELAELQAMLAGVQSADSGYTLSDRNVIQMVLKMVETKKVEVGIILSETKLPKPVGLFAANIWDRRERVPYARAT